MGDTEEKDGERLKREEISLTVLMIQLKGGF